MTVGDWTFEDFEVYTSRTVRVLKSYEIEWEGRQNCVFC